MANPTSSIFLKIRNAKLRPVPSFAEASRLYCEARDKSGKGASEFPFGMLFDASGRMLGHVSYNGKVWRGAPSSWTTSDSPLFNPYSQEA